MIKTMICFLFLSDLYEIFLSRAKERWKSFRETGSEMESDGTSFFPQTTHWSILDTPNSSTIRLDKIWFIQLIHLPIQIRFSYSLANQSEFEWASSSNHKLTKSELVRWICWTNLQFGLNDSLLKHSIFEWFLITHYAYPLICKLTNYSTMGMGYSR